MTITIDFWQVIGFLSGIVVALATLAWLLIGQLERRLDERFIGLQEESKEWRALEKRLGDSCRDMDLRLAQLHSDTAEKYIRREDYIRGQTVIEAKLDAISSELKLVQIQGAQRHAGS